MNMHRNEDPNYTMKIGKEKTGHTPTPWEIDNHYEREPCMVKIVPKDLLIGIVAVFGNTDNEAEANAAFIVRAVNSHEALLEALKTIANRGGADIDYATIGNIARQAISLVERK